MAPEALDSGVRARLSAQRRRDTGIELDLRRRLHRDGFRFRLFIPVPARPRRTIDIAFMRERVAVMVDGCFWHACPLHRTQPSNNGEWWTKKLQTNVARDLDSTLALEQGGWAVIRVWEHENPVQAVDAIEALVTLRRAGFAATKRSV